MGYRSWRSPSARWQAYSLRKELPSLSGLWLMWLVNLERCSAWGRWEREFNPKIATLSLILLGWGRENRRLAYLRQKLLNALGYASFQERWMPAIPEDRRQERSALDTQSMAGIFYTKNEWMRLLVKCQCIVVWVKQEPVLGQIPPGSLTNHFLHRNRLWTRFPWETRPTGQTAPGWHPQLLSVWSQQTDGKLQRKSAPFS